MKMKHPTSPTPSRSSFLSSYGSRSPLPEPANYRTGCMSATTKSYKYLRRLFKFDQMDFQYALWQMWYLFISPQKVFRNSNYRKQTKAQFARDDPAFLVLLIISLCVTSIGFALVLKLGIWQSLFFLLYVVFIDCILTGIIVASLCWIVSNKYFRTNDTSIDIEWGYAFDVHLNAFFPPLIILHFIQLFFYNGFISQDWFISRLLGNSLWLMATTYYVYITFLGYNCIPNLKNTRIILALIPILFILYMITIIIGWNISVSVMNFYHYRVL